MIGLALLLVGGMSQGAPAPWPAISGSLPLVSPKHGPLKLEAGLIALNPAGVKAKTVELALQVNAEGGFLRMEKAAIEAKNGRFRLVTSTGSQALGFFKPGRVVDIALALEPKGTAIYLDGHLAWRLGRGVMPTLMIGGRPNKGQLLGAQTYQRVLIPAELAKNADAAKKLLDAEPVADTPTVTMEAELKALTPVPDPKRIKPYREAMLAHEYRILSLVSGHINGLKPGAIVRVFRLGISDGKPTALKDAKVGDKVRLTIMPLDTDANAIKLYQLDTLDSEVPVRVYIETVEASK